MKDLELPLESRLILGDVMDYARINKERLTVVATLVIPITLQISVVLFFFAAFPSMTADELVTMISILSVAMWGSYFIVRLLVRNDATRVFFSLLLMPFLAFAGFVVVVIYQYNPSK